MTLNTIGYLIYLPITAYITIVVGDKCHKHGIHYIKSILKNDPIAYSINNLLLIGYYLVNLGYALISIMHWNIISTTPKLIEEISLRTAYIILLLTLLHYTNIIGLSLWNKYHLKRKTINN